MEFLEILETQEFQNHSQNFEEDKRDEGGKEDEGGECGKYWEVGELGKGDKCRQSRRRRCQSRRRRAEMEKRVDTADISVLFFSSAVLIFWLLTRKQTINIVLFWTVLKAIS